MKKILIGLVITGLLLMAGCSSTLSTSNLQSGVDVASGVVIFPDKNLETVIRQVLNNTNRPILPEELAGLTVLDANGCDIASIEGIEYCTNLNTIYLAWNNIVDISPLAGLKGGVRHCTDEYNQPFISTPLEISLAGNPISDISLLANLTSPSELTLNLAWTDITDITPLAGLSNLIYLDVSFTHLVFLPDLSQLVNLSRFYFWRNQPQIRDLSPLNGLPDFCVVGY
jgi:hypothetical protein